MKTTNSQQQFLQICCNEFHQNRTVNVDSTDRNARSKMLPSLQRFSWNVITVRIYVKIFYTNVYISGPGNVDSVGRYLLTVPSKE
jgi:hypothetical protein